MKILVLSDIHGNALTLETALKSFSNFDLLLLCGDYLNHGPRNPLTEGWNPKNVAAILNSYQEKIICVRGNCDSEVDEMVLNFPCLNAYTNLFFSTENLRENQQKSSQSNFNGRIFVHHGHLYDKEKLKSWLPKGTLIVSGHTHVIVLEEDDGYFFFNPGSISLPKCDDGQTCGILEIDEEVEIKLCSIDGNVIRKKKF